MIYFVFYDLGCTGWLYWMSAFPQPPWKSEDCNVQLLGRENDNHNYIERRYCSRCPYTMLIEFSPLWLWSGSRGIRQGCVLRNRRKKKELQRDSALARRYAEAQSEHLQTDLISGFLLLLVALSYTGINL